MTTQERPKIESDQVEFAVSSEIARLEDMKSRMTPEDAALYLKSIANYIEESSEIDE